MSFTELKNRLAEGQTVEINYQKLDGTARSMRVTLRDPTDSSHVPVFASTSAWEVATTIRVFDLIIHDWRSVRAEGLLSILSTQKATHDDDVVE
ncbi:MAG: hypothetical protein DDT26_01818 [Dehalococcoidia bacterium]|nr:hypothetical protein [Chloroflexota bacterium]